MTPSLMPRKKLDFFNETLNQFMKNFSITYKCIPGVRRVEGRKGQDTNVYLVVGGWEG